MTKKRRALSMTESMYFALSEYTNQLNEELVSENGGKPKASGRFTPTGVNSKILIGDLPPIPQSCVIRGRELAAIVEEKRRSEPSKPKEKETDHETEFFGGVSSF